MKTHPLNATYLVIGLVFLATAGFWALHEAGLVAAADVSWLGPLALILAGGAGLLATVLKGSRRSRTVATDESEYQPRYDPPLRQDYTSDLDRRLAEQQTTAVTTTDEPTDPTPDDTAVIRTTDQHETKEEDR